MPPIPEKEDSKEITLFGEKSIKEHAYRQKIIELEMEVMKLEAALKGEGKEAVAIELPQSEDIEKIKRYEKLLEAKAKTIADELNTQALNLVKQERMHSRVIAAKKTFTILSTLVSIAIVLSLVSFFIVLKLNERISDKNLNISASYQRPDNIKNLLQKNGFYKNQYTITGLDFDNRVYTSTVELHFKPYDKWSIKMIASDIIDNFKRVASEKSIKLNFVYEGEILASADFSPIDDQIHYKYLNN